MTAAQVEIDGPPPRRGWRVLRFTARMLEETPHLVLAAVTGALPG